MFLVLCWPDNVVDIKLLFPAATTTPLNAGLAHGIAAYGKKNANN